MWSYSFLLLLLFWGVPPQTPGHKSSFLYALLFQDRTPRDPSGFCYASFASPSPHAGACSGPASRTRAQTALSEVETRIEVAAEGGVPATGLRVSTGRASALDVGIISLSVHSPSGPGGSCVVSSGRARGYPFGVCKSSTIVLSRIRFAAFGYIPQTDTLPLALRARLKSRGFPRVKGRTERENNGFSLASFGGCYALVRFVPRCGCVGDLDGASSLRRVGDSVTEKEREMQGKVVHCMRDSYDVYIGRGADPKTGEPGDWGNPFSHKEGTRAEHVVGSVEEAVEAYRQWLWSGMRGQSPEQLRDVAELHGKTLGCWCKPGPCHGDVLVAAAAWAYGQLNQEGDVR